jgi:hypothetical protein
VVVGGAELKGDTAGPPAEEGVPAAGALPQAITSATAMASPVVSGPLLLMADS